MLLKQHAAFETPAGAQNLILLTSISQKWCHGRPPEPNAARHVIEIAGHIQRHPQFDVFFSASIDLPKCSGVRQVCCGTLGIDKNNADTNHKTLLP